MASLATGMSEAAAAFAQAQQQLSESAARIFERIGAEAEALAAELREEGVGGPQNIVVVCISWILVGFERTSHSGEFCSLWFYLFFLSGDASFSGSAPC